MSTSASLISAFPKEFLWGTATSEYQVSGADHCPDSDWAWHENHSSTARQNTGFPLPYTNHGINHWNNVYRDVLFLKKLGVTSYRFSVEWSKIEPRKGQYDQEAIAHYKRLCDELNREGIKPMITLHHFTIPQWFAEQGGFEKEGNIQSFVSFCEYVFSQIGEKVNLWTTINEPAVYALMGYLLGRHPPFKKNGDIAVVVLVNMLKAHCFVYQALKKIRPGAQVGIAHSVLSVLKEKTYSNAKLLEATDEIDLNYFFNESVMNFFKNRQTELNMRDRAALNVNSSVLAEFSAEKLTDWFGINYYTSCLYRAGFSCPPSQQTCQEGEQDKSYAYRFEPSAIEHAIRYANQLGFPIYITETGTPYSDNPRLLTSFAEKVISATGRCIEEGADIRGIYWSSMADSYEWASGYNPKIRFGLARYDKSSNSFAIKNGAKVFLRAIKHHKNRFVDIDV